MKIHPRPVLECLEVLNVGPAGGRSKVNALRNSDIRLIIPRERPAGRAPPFGQPVLCSSYAGLAMHYLDWLKILSQAHPRRGRLPCPVIMTIMIDPRTNSYDTVYRGEWNLDSRLPWQPRERQTACWLDSKGRPIGGQWPRSSGFNWSLWNSMPRQWGSSWTVVLSGIWSYFPFFFFNHDCRMPCSTFSRCQALRMFNEANGATDSLAHFARNGVRDFICHHRMWRGLICTID